MKYLLMCLLSLCVAGFSFAKDKSELIHSPQLSFSTAQKMATACMDWQAKNKIPNLAIAIFNQEAQLIYFARMDGVSVGVTEVAMKKAESAAKFRFSTRDTSGWIQRNPGVATIDSIAGITGGLPITTSSGKPLGGIGVSGAMADDDERCAQAALDTVKKDLMD
jgi:glc operon protein GlcG